MFHLDRDAEAFGDRNQRCREVARSTANDWPSASVPEEHEKEAIAGGQRFVHPQKRVRGVSGQ